MSPVYTTVRQYRENRNTDTTDPVSSWRSWEVVQCQPASDDHQAAAASEVLPGRGDVMRNTFWARWRHPGYFLGTMTSSRVLPEHGDVIGNTFLAWWRHREYFLGAVKCVNNVLVTTGDGEERRRVSDDDERQTVVENVEQIVVLNLWISYTQTNAN